MARKTKKTINFTLFIIIIILTLWGIFTLGTSSFPLSLKNFASPWHYLTHQLIMLFLGIILGIIAFLTPLEKLKKWSPYLFLFSLLLLIMVFIPSLGIKTKGASRWLNFHYFSIQPSEFLKITFILYLSAWLAGRKKIEKKNIFSQLIPFMIVLATLGFVLIKQPDMTTLFIIGSVGILLYFFSPAPFWHIISLLILGASSIIMFIVCSSYRFSRLVTFLNPSYDPLGRGYQIKQAGIAIGSGKIFGIGNGMSLGMSQQKFGFLPEATTDSIFAIIAEEMGFIGSIVLLFLFLFLCYQGLKIALKFKDEFAGFLALGITFWITIQAFCNIGGIIQILPLGGIPLPFFSYGGSHIMAEMIGCGILLNISRQK